MSRAKEAMRGVASRGAVRLADRAPARRHIPLPDDYPPSADLRSRWGHGRSSNRALESLIRTGEDRYRANLERFLEFEDDLAEIPLAPRDGEPGWRNGWLPGMDAAAIYCFLRHRTPHLYLEIGSGNSTAFARRAIRDGGLPTEIISIDPQPRREIDALCDSVIRSPLELADLSVIERLRPGDVVFFDGSHRLFTNSDVATYFLEVLPSIPPGVLVGIHDIYLPDDYPPEIVDRYYSEQYMLGAYLLGAGDGDRIELPAHFASTDQGLSEILDPLWSHPGLADAERHGVAFWLRSA